MPCDARLHRRIAQCQRDVEICYRGKPQRRVLGRRPLLAYGGVHHDQVTRELRRRIILAFEKEGIPLGNDPANMLILRPSNPTAPPAQQPVIGS